MSRGSAIEIDEVYWERNIVKTENRKVKKYYV